MYLRLPPCLHGDPELWAHFGIGINGFRYAPVLAYPKNFPNQASAAAGASSAM
jgi:hypothetical protein